MSTTTTYPVDAIIRHVFAARKQKREAIEELARKRQEETMARFCQLIEQADEALSGKPPKTTNGLPSYAAVADAAKSTGNGQGQPACVLDFDF